MRACTSLGHAAAAGRAPARPQVRALLVASRGRRSGCSWSFGRWQGGRHADGSSRAWRRLPRRCAATADVDRGPSADDEDEPGVSYLSDEEVDALLEEAAGFISFMDELRPLDPAAYNPFAECWTRIARIPPEERYRLLPMLEPGSLRSLWKASVGRYVLAEARAATLFAEASVWDDFPRVPGQVYEYEGRCEEYVLTGGMGGGRAAADNMTVGLTGSVPGAPSRVRFDVDKEQTERMGSSTPWLRPDPGGIELPTSRFTLSFFVPPAGSPAAVEAEAEARGLAEAGGAEAAEAAEALGGPVVYGRTVLPLLGPIGRWWEPLYCRLQVGLVLTPLAADAGADVQLVYPAACGGPSAADLGGQEPGGSASGPSSAPASRAPPPDPLFAQLPLSWGLVGVESLPPGQRFWPPPDPESYSVSPLSGTGRDYLRVAGPGVYVGCAYRPGPASERGRLREEDFVYFAIARKA
ncbi:hypothetical protein HYH03_008586 [Edaphochlamys debaryana]|uniref:Uncharacterized protein n=1 Tax=Edaphochlamys debaryana TaxID=47281 RepID=A0A836BZA4_9CHLO|nr:hypothetical protein HYH03_008586 [Edaphochlamys debaryana]|eukprot:KAG2493164.1 hypothetical protein HYH03_008586 [Edaphochlamys debaryana]